MAPAPRRAPGDRVGPFEIERYLASGGMGDVYVARADATGERVALKVLADLSRANLERFEREGRIAATLAHPHIVAGRGQGRTDDGAAYLAMELLSGSDLDGRLKSPGVSPSEAVAVVSQVLDALEFAHARRIVHRDLKPQNIFLCDAGPAAPPHVKVLDFGIARVADERRMTGTGMILGTWSYMSPEQARAEPDVDHRSDLWSLGVVLFECLAGRLPFDAPTGPGTLYQILFERPPDLAQLRPDLPRPLVDVVERALGKTRDERYATASAMRAALAAVDVAGLAAAPSALRRRAFAQPTTGTNDTVSAEVAETMARASEGGADGSVENRLTSVAFLRGVREGALVEDLARELQGRVVHLVGDAVLVLFGVDRWNGDEPFRAVRLAVAAAPSIGGAGVATGRVLRGAPEVAGAAVDSAAALARRGGVTLDATTASVVRNAYALQPRADGTAFLDPRAQRVRRVVHDAAFATPFLGRDAELAMLVQAAESAAQDAQPGGVVALGAVGMGKSRLRHEAVAELLRRDGDATVLVGRCEAFRRDAPFAALAEALADVVDEPVARAFAAAAGSTGDPVAAIDRARSALEVVLRDLAARGALVLAVDDAQWLDAPSQSAIRWVCENAPDLPLAVWLFARPEARAQVAAVVPGASVVELKPLAKGVSERLLRAVAGSAPEALLERAGGHPLFLEELGRMYAARGDASLTSGASLPPSIEGAHLAQIDGLDPLDREFLKRAAVFGRTAWAEGVAALGGDAAAMEKLRRANVVVARPRSRFEGAREFAFRSGVLHEVAYGLWPEAQRARLHDRAAGWLAAQPGVAPDELARHWDLAGERARAAEAYVAAAERSGKASDAATTCAFAERALELADDDALRWRALVARDDALQASGDREVQRAGLDALEAIAARRGAAERTEAAWRRCFFARITSQRDAAVAAGEAAIALAAQTDAPRWGSAANNELALLYADEGRFDDATAHALGARRLANRAGDEWLVARAIGTQAYVAGLRGDAVEALELFELCAARYARAGDRRREALAFANAAAMMIDLGRLGEAAERLGSAIEASKRVGNARTVAVATHNVGVLARIHGDLAAATAHQAFAEAEARRLGHPRLLGAVAVERVYLALVSGADPEEVDRLARDAVELMERTRSPELVASARAAAMRQRARSGVVPDGGDVARARALLPTLKGHPRADLLAALYEACGGAGDREAALAAIEELAAPLGVREERVACREAFAQRYLAPRELVEA